MFHPNGLTPKELVFLAELMDQGSDSIARQMCEDMSDKEDRHERHIHLSKMAGLPGSASRRTG